jgi:hypothetical protein
VNYDRQSRLWRVRETQYCLFHLEPPLHEDPDVTAIVEGADGRYLRVRDVLGQPELTIKERERLLRLNFWLYGESAIADEDMPPGAKRFSTGAGSPAGIVFAQRGGRWSECVIALTHETIHVLWGAEVGEAPSLLNEGVAEYYQALLAASPDAALRNLARTWAHVIASGEVSLRDVCRNEFFWRGRRQDCGLPPGIFYHVGGALVGYLVEAHGRPLLRQIFLETHYRDEHLASTLERLTGLALQDLAARVSTWWPGRLSRRLA